jgi:hypothetical protein
VIEMEKATYPIKRMCELLEVSRSGYYKWRVNRDAGPTPTQRRRAELDAKVAKFHAASDGVYGAPRICADLRADGERVSRKTVAASLRRQHLAGISPRRFAPATTVVDLDAAVPQDLVRRCFDTGALNRVWTSDITYLRTVEGWLYLCAVRDGCSRRVIGWAIDDYLHTDLVQAALAMAVALRGELADEVILHADRGCQGEFNWPTQHLDDGGVVWVFGSGSERFSCIGGRFLHLAVRRWRGGRTGSGSGLRSLAELRPRQLLSRRVCLGRLRSAGSVTLAA